MQNQDSTAINHLYSYTVRIKAGDYIGAGVVVTDKGLILTCYHIIKNAKDQNDPIEVYFPSMNNLLKYADIFKANESLDIAFLQLKDMQLPSNEVSKVVAPLSQKVVPGNDFWSVGFREDSLRLGLDARGWIGMPNYTDLEGHNLDREVIPIYSGQLASGMSGSAVLDLKSKRVVGIVSQGFQKRDAVDYKSLALATPIATALSVYDGLRLENWGLQEISKSYENVMEYINFVIEGNDYSTDLFSSSRDSPQRRLHEYYVEQDVLLISGDGSKYWMSEDKDIISHQLGKPNNRKGKARKIIETELLKQDDFYLLIGAPFGGGTSTLAKWLAYSYASEYSKAYSDDPVRRNDDTPAVRYENESHCIPVVLSLRKGSAIDKEIYNVKGVNDVLEDIIAPSLEFNPAKILLILDGVDQLDSDEIKNLKEKIHIYRERYHPSLRVLLLSKLTLHREASDLIERRFARLLPFNDSQAQKYFRNVGGINKKDYDKLKTSYQELVTKPLFAWMICLIHAHARVARHPVIKKDRSKLKHARVARHPVIKKDWSKLKQNALVYMYFFALIGKSKYPDGPGDSENNNRRSWFRVLRAIAAFKHISKNDDITFDGLTKKLAEVKIEVDKSLNIASKEAFEPIIVETPNEDVDFAHESFRNYLLATFYIESLLSYSSNNTGNRNAKENYLEQYNVNIGFEIADTSKIIDFLEGLLEILLDKSDNEADEAGRIINLRDCFGYSKRKKENISYTLAANTKAILANHYRLISDIRDALEENPWLKKWYENEKKTLESAKFFKIGNLWIHLWISLFVNNKLEPGLKVKEIKDLDQILVLSSNRIPPDLKRMKGIDFSETDISGIDLFRADLSSAIIAENRKKYTNIQKSKLCGANLCEAKLIEAELMHSDLSNAKLFNALMYGVDLSDANLLRADLSGIKLKPVDEESQNETYREAKFSNANLGDTNISDAKMKGINLSDSDLYRANLCDADLSYAILENTKLSYAILAYANLSHATFKKTILSDANLSEANLVGVNLSEADLSNANLSNAKVFESVPSVDGDDITKPSKPIDKLLFKTIPDESESDIPILPYIVALFSKPITDKNIEVNLRRREYGSSIDREKMKQNLGRTIKPTRAFQQENHNNEIPLDKHDSIKDGAMLVFKPSSQLDYSTDYAVTIKDSDIELPLKKWSFTTTSKRTGQPLKVLEVTGNGHDGNVFQNTIDGKLFTRWSNYGSSWIRFDLGSEYDVCAVDIAWHKGDKRTYDFEISTSTDDKENFILVKNGKRTSRNSLSAQREVFDHVKARYVKITVNGNSQNNWASIAEVAFYKCGNSSS